MVTEQNTLDEREDERVQGETALSLRVSEQASPREGRDESALPVNLQALQSVLITAGHTVAPEALADIHDIKRVMYEGRAAQICSSLHATEIATLLDNHSTRLAATVQSRRDVLLSLLL